MRRRVSIGVIAFSFLLALPSFVFAADDEQRACASLVPESVAAYAELRAPGRLVKTFFDSDLRKRIEASDAWKTFKSTPGYTQSAMGLGIFQAVVGRSLWDAIDVAASREVAVALRPKADEAGPDALLLVRGDDEAAADQILQGVVKLLTADGKSIATTESRAGATLTTVRDRLHLARLGKTIAVASDVGLLREVAVLAAAKTTDATGALAASELFRAARSRAPKDADGFAYVDLKRVAAKRPGGKIVPDAFDNPVGALLFADLAPAVREAQYFIASLTLESNGAALDVRVPAKMSGPASTPPAIATPRVPRLLGTIAVPRDLAAMWSARDKLLDANALSGTAQFNSFMGILFAGKQFGDDVLPEIGPELLFVSARQEWPAEGPAPQPKIPAFALVLHLKNAKAFGPRLEVAFQTTMGVINADRGQKAKQPFSLRTEMVDGVDVTTARSIEEASGATLPMTANYTTSIAQVGDRFVLSSTRALCIDLVHAYQRGDLDAAAVGDRVAIRGPVAYEALHENEEALIANDMLEKGSSRLEATGSIRALMEIVRLFDSGEIVRVTDGGTTGLRARVTLRTGT